MEQEILSWLHTKYKTGKETDFIPKESLWDEFASERDVKLSREEYFADLGRCISQGSWKGIKVARCKGKRNGYKGLRKKQERKSLHMLAEVECIPSNSYMKEGEESEKGGQATNDLVQYSTRNNDKIPHTNQDDIARVEENNVQSFYSVANSQRSDKNERSEDKWDEVPSNANLEDEQISSGKESGVCQENAPDEEASPLQKRRQDKKKENGEIGCDNAEVPSNACPEHGQTSSENERGACQENAPDGKEKHLQKRGKADKNESSGDRGCDAEVPSNADLEDRQTSSEHERGVCKENAPEEDRAPLAKKLEVKDTIFEEESCATGLMDAEDYQIIRAILLTRLLSPQNRISEVQNSSSSSSSTVGFGSSKSRKRQIKHPKKKEKSLG